MFFTSEAGFFTSFHDFNNTVYIYSIPRCFVSPNHGLVVGDKSASPFLIEEFSQLDYLIARFLNLNFGRRTKCVTCNQCLTTISWLFRVILKGRVDSKNYINQLFTGRSERIWTSDPYVPKVIVYDLQFHAPLKVNKNSAFRGLLTKNLIHSFFVMDL